MVLLSGCGVYDYRNDVVKAGITENLEKKGKNILREMEKAHGLHLYQEKENARFYLQDEWRPGILKTFGMPWSESNEKLQLDYLIGTNDIRLTFLENIHRGEVWGLQNWACYKEVENEVSFKQKNKLKFWLPTVQYFMEMPFVIGTADIISYAGTEKFDGKTYDLVFISWGKSEPQRKIDQYVLWINQETKLLDMAQFTVRDQHPLINGTMHYNDYRNVNGIMISFNQIAARKMGQTDKYLHKFTVSDVVFDTTIPKEKFYPNASISYSK